MSDEPEAELPELSERDLEDLAKLDPDTFARRPEVESAIQLKDVEPMRRWVAKVMRGEDYAYPIGYDEGVIERGIHGVVETYRKAGIDLYDPEQLLAAMFSYQEASTDIFRAVNSAVVPIPFGNVMYLTVAAPIFNQSFAYELLVYAVFGEAAALPPEGGE